MRPFHQHSSKNISALLIQGRTEEYSKGVEASQDEDAEAASLARPGKISGCLAKLAQYVARIEMFQHMPACPSKALHVAA